MRLAFLVNDVATEIDEYTTTRLAIGCVAQLEGDRGAARATAPSPADLDPMLGRQG